MLFISHTFNILCCSPRMASDSPSKKSRRRSSNFGGSNYELQQLLDDLERALQQSKNLRESIENQLNEVSTRLVCDEERLRLAEDEKIDHLRLAEVRTKIQELVRSRELLELALRQKSIYLEEQQNQLRKLRQQLAMATQESLVAISQANSADMEYKALTYVRSFFF